MEENASQQDLLWEQLGITDESIRFLVLIILSVLLSFWSVLIQRGQLVCTLEGDARGAQAAPDVFPIKIAAGALVVGSLGFFLMLALNTCKTAAQGEDPVARHSASMNVWASLLVLTAALIRLYDLNYVRNHQPTLTQDDPLPG